MNKKDLSERDVCSKFIGPAIKRAGWDGMMQIREEVAFTKGRIIVRGKLVTRGKAKRADYILYYKPNIPIAIVEAKDNNHSVGDGMQQALDYATTLNIPFVFSSNGDGFVFHDRTGASKEKEASLSLDQFPSSKELWSKYCAWKGLTPKEEEIVLQDYFDDGSGKAPRYYQTNAINATIEAIAKGQNRILLVMATGTGKTYTAFQIIWRLWKAGRKKRILFLAGRNVLVDQTMVNDFRPFGAAMAKLSTGAKTIERQDQLAEAQTERECRRDRLAAATLYQINGGSNREDFGAHARFYLDHLAQLVVRPEQNPFLRRTVLNLAVCGALTPQDPHDESVAEQLLLNDRVREATAKQDHRAEVERQILLAAEDRWNVPASWEWCALADLVLFIDYRGKTPNKIEKGVRLVTAKNVKKGFINTFPEEFLSEREYRDWMTRGFPEEGDILFTTEAPMGNAAVVRLPERFALAQRVICFRAYGAANPDFLALQLLAQPFQSILDKTATGLTAKGIKAAKLRRLPVAVPPLAEQLRIVVKVNEVMQLCDRLESQLTKTQDEKCRLLEAVLHHALTDTLESTSPKGSMPQTDLLPSTIPSFQ